MGLGLKNCLRRDLNGIIESNQSH
uniref:Uncharacterized protein n=1 Tax=Rhizophora mucronata TaxID=61149 RepID=A0A2P2PGH5_RHIMU